jgi:hypothetical protein
MYISFCYKTSMKQMNGRLLKVKKLSAPHLISSRTTPTQKNQ